MIELNDLSFTIEIYICDVTWDSSNRRSLIRGRFRESPLSVGLKCTW